MSHNYAEKISLSSVASADAADADRQSEAGMGYQQTLMYGRYSKTLGDYAKVRDFFQYFKNHPFLIETKLFIPLKRKLTT